MLCAEFQRKITIYQNINSSYFKQIEHSKMRAFLMDKSGKVTALGNNF